MDLVEFLCPVCGKLLAVAARYGGETVRCPACSSQVVVPRKPG